MLRHPLAVLAALSCLAPTVWSADVPVLPGDGTLAAAVAAASSGDTLVLQDGTFGGNVTVDKSLTLRAASRGTYAVVTGQLRVYGDGITVTAQRLRFTASMSITQAAAVRVLENEFSNSAGINIDGTVGPASESPAVVIVGNRMARGWITEDAPYVSGGLYVAGNTLLDGRLSQSSPGWIVGNYVAYSGHQYTAYYCIYVASAGAARILANRVLILGLNSIAGGIRSDSPYTVVQSNIIESARNNVTGIRTPLRTGYATVVNNLITGTFSAGIAAMADFQRISGNIITNGSQQPIYINAPSYEVSNNLCWNNDAECPADDGNLNADPKFVDLVGYRLAPNSPAIDAGPADYEFADLDRSRNDMGAHGGPYSIGQYDVQRDPANLAPFVYPLVNSAGGGILEAQALGVARLR